MSRGGVRGGGRQTWRRGLCADSREPDAGLELTNREITTWAKVGCLTYWDTQVTLQIQLGKKNGQVKQNLLTGRPKSTLIVPVYHLWPYGNFSPLGFFADISVETKPPVALENAGE